MSIKVAGAPISWGVWDDRSEVPGIHVLDDIAACGYAGTELGPPGYFGDAAELRSALAQRSLSLVGAFLPLPYSKPELAARNLADAEASLDMLESSSPDGTLPRIVLSDAYQEPDRIALAGRIADHPEAWLDEAGWEALLANVGEISRRCRERGFEVAFHPHGGSYIETPEEIDRLMAGTDPETVGLCIDTGHAFFGGGDPLDLMRRHGDRLRLVHLKDVDLDVLAELKRDGYGIEEAWKRGIFCELGAGGVDLDGFLGLIEERGYDGWIVVEQDRVLEGADALARAHESEARNRDFLRRRGI